MSDLRSDEQKNHEAYVHIKDTEDFKIRTGKLSVDSGEYEKIKKQVASLFPIIKQFDSNNIVAGQLTCEPAIFSMLAGLALERLSLVETLKEIELKVDKSLVHRSGEGINTKSGRTNLVLLNNTKTLDMIPELVKLLTQAQLKEGLPDLQRTTSYYSSESLGFISKHIAASIVDEAAGTDCVSRFATIESLVRLKNYMQFLMMHDQVRPDQDPNVAKAVVDYDAKEVTSELTGLLGFARYQENPNTVRKSLGFALTGSIYTGDDFLKEYNLTVPFQDAKAVLQKTITTIQK